MIWIWSWYLHWLQNAKTLKLKCLFFSHFMKWNQRPLISKSWHFAVSEDIMTKSKSQGLHIIRIKYWNARVACLWSKMPTFHRAGMREGGKPLPQAFQYLILMVWRPCDLNLVIIFSLAAKCQDFEIRGLQFHFIKLLKSSHPNCWHFEASVAKFKSQGLHIKRIKKTFLVPDKVLEAMGSGIGTGTFFLHSFSF